MARKADLVAAASRRYQRALESQAEALAKGDEEAIQEASMEAEKARKRLDALVSTARPLLGAAGGGAAGGAVGAALGGPIGAAVGAGIGAAGGGYLTTPKVAQSTTKSKEIKVLKSKLLK